MRAKLSQETGLDHLRKANRILVGISDDEAAKQLHMEVIQKLCSVLIKDKGLDEAMVLAKKAT